ncbi:hypothetical protein N7519_000869 [Penicillium mononematosum]|uniref:uncharacterized protein n=1 Tax=Penicillium mononematosum TaxID=268346 RepID=UPI00254995CD|nr:uncharacterized protein N7519_000869 [Penicillium mononematosum]KAJ6190848.1 hypothetical protein N7519_000869 [Penicillium mononematosum]
MRAISRLFSRSYKTSPGKLSSWCGNHDLFEYTSGRFLFNEKLRRAERHLRFDVDALARAICHSVSRHLNDVVSITKLAEGGFNRVLQITFDDGYAVLARLPYKTTVPKHYSVASEAATLAFLRSHGVPVPEVLGYSPDHANTVGAEYILLEKTDGTPLSDQWFSIDTKTRVKIMKQIVEAEKQFMSIRFPANQIVIGPNQERALLEIDRGPFLTRTGNTFTACFDAPARRETDFCERFGKPRLHKRSPARHQLLLSDYLKLVPYLEVPPDHPLSRPTLRHPDFSPNNILWASFDWQHAVVLPLCLCAGIPNHFQNWGDPLSETLAKPEVKLPENFDQLSQEEQAMVQETMRIRIVHFYYAALTMTRMPDHFDAFRDENSMLRAKLFHCAGAPWEGDSLSLKHALIQAYRNWPMYLDGESKHAQSAEFPVHYSEEEIEQCLNEYKQEQEKLQELVEMRDLIDTDALGWVPNEDELEKSMAVIQAIKEGLMANSSTEIEKTALLDHFPFDDHDEHA